MGSCISMVHVLTTRKFDVNKFPPLYSKFDTQTRKFDIQTMGHYLTRRDLGRAGQPSETLGENDRVEIKT